MKDLPTSVPVSEIFSESHSTREPLEGLAFVITEREGVTYYSLSSDSEQYVGGFEVARFDERDEDDPEISVRWKTSQGFGAAPMMAGEYIDQIEKAVMGEEFRVDDVYGCVGTAFSAGAEVKLDRLPHLGDFERMYQEASKNGMEEIRLFKYRWPGLEMPRGEMWLISERMTVRSYVDENALGENGITAMSNFFNATALYPEYTQDFAVVLRHAFGVQSDK